MCLRGLRPPRSAPKATAGYMAIRSDRMAGATAMRLALQLYPCML